MMRWRLAAVIAVAMLSSATAAAYCVKQVSGASDISAWKGTVSYHVSASLTDADKLAAIDAAFATWQAVDCSTLEFTKGADFAIDSIPFQSHGQKGIYIFWYDTATNWPDDPKYSSTSFFGTNASGEITQASIAINAFSTDMPWATDGSASALDLQAEMTSFIGQVIGIGYSDVADSIMTSGMSYGDVDKRTLKDDDIAAAQHLYLEANCPEPKPPGVCGTTPPPDGGPPPSDSTTPPSDSTTPPPSDSTTPPPSDSVPPDDSTTPPGDGFAGCTTDTDCPDGLVCADEGICVTPKQSDDGCCSVSASRPRSFSVLLGALFGLLLLWRRRSR